MGFKLRGGRSMIIYMGNFKKKIWDAGSTFA
jgi:hypothetical protein